MQLVLSLLQQMSVSLVIAYLFSKSPLLRPLANYSVRLPHKVLIYVIFSCFCILGTYVGLDIDDAIANTRAVGAVLGGLLGGPLVGCLVGLTGGLHRYTLGGFTDLACAISTTCEGLLGGLVHWRLMRAGRVNDLFAPRVAFFTTFVAEIMQMVIILLVATPFDKSLLLVRTIATPMILANSCGAALFISMIRDQQRMYEKFSRVFSAKALTIANRTVGIMSQGFTPEASGKIAHIVQEETGVGAVAITDTDKILAFIGTGEDHHKPGTPITSAITLQAIAQNKVLFADGNSQPYRCSISPQCQLGSVLVIPLQGDEGVIGTIKLYEPKKRLFLKINHTLGEGIANLLSQQLLAGRLEQQQRLLVQSELKLVQAQINPHFLFNTLNTISAITRRDPGRARELLLHLSRFFRNNLKRQSGLTTLREEQEHCLSYLEIEQARFGERLTVINEIPPHLAEVQLPSFTLQPLIENAIKHGICSLLGEGRLRLFARETPEAITLCVEDNAGAWQPSGQGDGLGMSLVDKRLKSAFGERYGIDVQWEPEQWTRVSLTLPRQPRTTAKEMT
ncbi:two-component system LytT family sensor kinase [Aeromonas caviae]|uniref:sensor histidine kinase n=1 Tax=Aeromonas TaxID=642 RepID=UPI0005EF2544|nr:MULTISPECIES: sensor histidine kinase [Aeromonas]ATP90184.1 sensor histidine kinase [Aeromonas caviae]KAB0682342.1 sensor histidine kinase [Aeromonas caviae]MBL0501499.1 sensor histidine kinase [Aeromonas caviae]MCP1600153.1 two-component system LytT family sensor kinase [Aeromonas caviae]MCR3984461.1 sensor histidine kinase [Aeromonas caviae]